MWYKILATQYILTLMTMHEIGGCLAWKKKNEAGAQVASCFLLTAAYVYAILIASDHRETRIHVGMSSYKAPGFMSACSKKGLRCSFHSSIFILLLLAQG